MQLRRGFARLLLMLVLIGFAAGAVALVRGGTAYSDAGCVRLVPMDEWGFHRWEMVRMDSRPSHAHVGWQWRIGLIEFETR